MLNDDGDGTQVRNPDIIDGICFRLHQDNKEWDRSETLVSSGTIKHPWWMHSTLPAYVYEAVDFRRKAKVGKNK